MAKGKKKATKSVRRAGNKYEDVSDDDSNIDTASVVSCATDSRYSSEDGTVVDLDYQDKILVNGGDYDDFEDRLKEAIDGTSSKSAKQRVCSLKAVHQAFLSRHLYDFLMEQKITILDMLERSVKKGVTEEQALGYSLLSLVCIQLGEDSEYIFTRLKSHLLSTLVDPTLSPSVRSQCATALGFFGFIVDGNCEDLPTIMDALFAAFSGSLLKGNGVPPTVKPEVSAMHTYALESWSLLSTILSQSQIKVLQCSKFRRIPELLQSSDLELRISAGEAIATFYEMARSNDEYFKLEKHYDLCEKLSAMAKVSAKNKAKKDSKQQRSSFRDIYKAIQDEEMPFLKKKIGLNTLQIESWILKRQYDSFCQTLGSGMNLHLNENELLRDIFDLPPVEVATQLSIKNTKDQRHYANMAADKMRTKTLSKLRDKRSDTFF